MRFVLGLVILILAACSGTTDQESKQVENSSVRVAVAANAYHAVDSISKSYMSVHPNIEIELIIGSSGKLSTQIIQGAPFDIFLSADQRYVQEILKRAHAMKSPQTYAQGALILWSFKDSTPDIESLLSSSGKISIPQPEHAPYGKAAVEAMHALGIYEKVKDRLVYGENVTQANVYLSKGSADYGFTALSVLHSPDLKEKGHFYLLSSLNYSPILQDMLLISNNPSATDFYKYLLSDSASGVWNSFGYEVPPAASELLQE